MKKRLDSLRIERFRQIRELSIPEVGHVNLIVGGNNSGKSGLLEALRLFAARAVPSLLEELLSLRGEFQPMVLQKESIPGPRGSAEPLCNLFFGRRFPEASGEAIYVGNVSRSEFVELEHVYYLGRVQQESDKKGASSSVVHYETVSKTEDSELFAAEGIEIRTHLRQVIIDFGELFDGVSRGARYERQVSQLPCGYVPPGFPLYSGLADAWDAIVLTDREQTALEALRIIEPRTEALAFVQHSGPSTVRVTAVRSLLEERVAVLKLKGQDGPVPLQSMGDGMTRVLQLILSALRAGDGLLLVDEFENGLHHSVQAKVWEMLFSLAQSSGLQVFATTHSNDCVRAFSQVAIANREVDGKLLKLERMPDDGRTVAATLGEDDLSNLLDAGIEVRG